MCPHDENEPEYMKVEYKTRKMYHPEHTGLCIEGVQCDRNPDGSFDVPVHLAGKAARMYGLTDVPLAAEEAPVGQPEAKVGPQDKPKGFFAKR